MIIPGSNNPRTSTNTLAPNPGQSAPAQQQPQSGMVSTLSGSTGTAPSPGTITGGPGLINGGAPVNVPSGPSTGPGASDFQKLAAQFPPTSGAYQFYMNLANNPSAYSDPNVQANIATMSNPAYTGMGTFNPAITAAANAGTPSGVTPATPTPPPNLSWTPGGTVTSQNPAPSPATPASSTASTLSGANGSNTGGSNLSGFLQNFQQFMNELNSPAGQQFNQFGTQPGGGTGGSIGGTGIAQLMQLLMGGGGYNPYGLSQYSRQQLQWPQFP